MASTTQTPSRAWEIDPGPILLVGQPPRLTGRLRIINRTGEKLKIKSLPLRLPPPQSGDPHRELELQVSARLAPHASAHAVAQVEISDDLAPGNYQAEVDIGGTSHAVVLHVLERREIAVLPEYFDLVAEPGSELTRPIVITNLGNVAAQMPKVALAPLGQRGAFFSSFHIAMAEKGEEGHQAALDRYAALLAKAEVQPIKAVLRGVGGESLAPGESRAAEIEFQIPAELARHGQYIGQFSIGNAICSIELQVENGAVNSNQRSRGKK